MKAIYLLRSILNPTGGIWVYQEKITELIFLLFNLFDTSFTSIPIEYGFFSPKAMVQKSDTVYASSHKVPSCRQQTTMRQPSRLSPLSPGGSIRPKIRLFFSMDTTLTALPKVSGDAWPEGSQEGLFHRPSSAGTRRDGLQHCLSTAAVWCSCRCSSSREIISPRHESGKPPITPVPPASYGTLVKSLSASCHLLGPIPPRTQRQIFHQVLAAERLHDWHLKTNTLEEISFTLSASGLL